MRHDSKINVVGAQSEFLTAAEAAAFLRLSTVTLGRWRIEGQGPLYRKFGRRVLYSHADLIEWADSQSRRSTSEQPVNALRARFSR
jgi:hypothetical protein